MRTSLDLPSPFLFFLLHYRVINLQSLQCSVLQFIGSLRPKSSIFWCVLLCSAQQRISQMNKKKTAGNQVLWSHITCCHVQCKTFILWQVILRFTGYSTEAFSLSHMNTIPDWTHSVRGQQYDIWTSYSLSPRLYSVSTQLSVLPMLNVAQLYSILLPSATVHILHNAALYGSCACYTLMDNSCRILKQLVLLVKVTVMSAQTEVCCKIADLSFIKMWDSPHSFWL